MNSIFTRRSVRKYLDKKVESERVDRILRAGMQAPSAGNQQPWEFIVVTDKEMLLEISKMSPYSNMVKDAGVAIILLGNKEFLKFPENFDHDMAACTENILLQVVEEGLGAVWLSATPLKERMNHLINIFKLNDNLIPFAVVPIGYPAEENTITDRFISSRIHYETY